MSLFPLRKKYFVAEGDDVPQRGRRRFLRSRSAAWEQRGSAPRGRA
jgi:hypothetical protein